MKENDNAFPHYYDGSAPVGADNPERLSETAPEAGTAESDEWRRFIGVNPFGYDAG
ncbi:hypothetical protein [uncultured Paenibacillus sp.]|uniref:hypothetical protein n=1 Tax=uncultured Paenibacillus sp. TaxID=227322 RepID=UPI0028D62EBD|nr:hypothetical protein [uncultured Paenibacillus sp.]